MKIFTAELKNSLIACFYTAVLSVSSATAESFSTRQQCENLQSTEASIQFSLYMQLEERRIHLQVPKIYFEDASDLVQGAEHRAQLFGLDFETLRPLTRIEQHTLNRKGHLKLLGVLLHDTVGPVKRLRYAIAAAKQWRVDKDSTAPIDQKPFRYGLGEVNLGSEPYDRVFFSLSPNGTAPISIVCPGSRPVRQKLCRHYFRSNSGIDVDLSYPMSELSRWKETQDSIENLLGCFLEN